MPLHKKGTYHAPVIVTSSIFVCPNCGQTNTTKGISGGTCPKCGSAMKLISSQTSPIGPIQKHGK